MVRSSGFHYTENFFSIEFSGLDYTNPSKNLYRYKLDNYDEEWVFANAGQRRAEYRKVDPGTYHFLVTGSNNDGIWNPTGISPEYYYKPSLVENVGVPPFIDPPPGCTFMEHHHTEDKIYQKKA